MKKTYKTPVSKVYNITNQHIIAASIPLASTPADASYAGGGDVNAFKSITDDLWNEE